MTGPAFCRLWDQAGLTVDAVEGSGPDLVIAFASVGQDAARPPAPEFVATATGRGTAAFPRRALFVGDATRSWASHPGFAPALVATVDQLRARAPVARIATVGLSMGAYAALAAMQVLTVDVALAFGPQYSVRDGIGPAEPRWARWTARLPPAPYPTAPLPAAGQGWACLFHGAQDDLAQAMAFPLQAGTDHLLFAGLTHSGLVPHLKARGALAGLMEAALAADRRRLLRIAASAGAQRRRA